MSRPRSRLGRWLDVPGWPPLARAVAGLGWVVLVLAFLVLVVRVPQRAYHAVRCGGEQDGAPSWSPDGRRLVFAGPVSCSSALFVVDRDGSHLHRLAESRSGDDLPVWAPDGRTIAFTTGSSIDTVRADGTHRTLLHTDRMDFGLGWSPDSQQIAFADGTLPGLDSELESKIEIMRADGRHVRSLEMPTLQAGTPAWSPDGTRIAVAGGNGLYVIDVASGRFVRVSRGFFASNPVAPAWAPDGRRLSYVDDAGLEIVDTRAHTLRTVVALHGGTFGDGSSWSSTGEIAFSLSNGDNRGIRRVRPDGRDLTWVAPL